MKNQLQHIADVQFGVSAKTSSKGNVICFQVQNITREGNLNLNTLFFTDDSEVSNSDFLQAGDVLLPAKGSKLSAVVMSEDGAAMTVASSSLFVIRINSEEILPEYLHWFLNLPRTQWQLEKEATGTNIPSLSIKYIRKLKIEIPDLEVQKKIVRLNELLEKEREINQKLNTKRRSYIETVTKELITKH